jgi:DUF4097 and DUF4098 domain-containing protein YvlB
MARYRRVQTIAHDIGPTGQLLLSVTSADVQITAGEGGAVEVQATFEVSASNEAEADTVFESIKLQVESSAGRLDVIERDDRTGLGAAFGQLFGGRHVELEEVAVTAPVEASIEVRSVSGDLRSSGFRGPQRLQTVSGDVRAIEAGGAIDIDSVSGDVSLRAVAPVRLKSNTVSGDQSVEAPLFEQLQANAVSGDASIDGGLAAGEIHRIDTVSGDVRLASPTGMTVSVRGLSSDVHASVPHRVEGSTDRRRLIVGDGAATVNFNSMSGDLSVVSSRQAATEAPKPAMPAGPAAAPTADERLAILDALEKGEIDVDEALRRLGSET